MHEHLDLLRREFEADRGTFLVGLRGEGLEWDRAAFSRFEKAMRWACEHFQDDQQLDRWMAQGFYYTSWFVSDWTSHPDFPRPEPEQYYNDCIQRIGDLLTGPSTGFIATPSRITGPTGNSPAHCGDGY